MISERCILLEELNQALRNRDKMKDDAIAQLSESDSFNS
jgi:hypothetical protein